MARRTGRPVGRPSPATPEEFVRAWQESSSVAEVCKRLGVDRNSACSRATVYRIRGIPMQKFSSSGTDWKALVGVAKAIAEKRPRRTR